MSAYLHFKVRYSYPFFGDYTYLQCYKIVIDELFEGKFGQGKSKSEKNKNDRQPTNKMLDTEYFE